MLESLFGKEETPTQVFLCEFCNFFRNILFYRGLPVAVSRFNFSNFSNSNPNSGRSLFINYLTRFFYKQIFYKKMSFKNPKTLRKY